MLDHVTLRATDLAASRAFYETVLATLGIERTSGDAEEFVEWDDFSLAQADDEHPPTRGLHVGFAAPSREHADRFWQTGVEAGYRDDGAPGPRPQYGDDYYGAFLLDPDGNSAEAVHHGTIARKGNVDHLWLRVADVGDARRFYETVAPDAALELRADTPERAQFDAGSASFSLVAGRPTQRVHLAFAAGENEIVDAFYRTATAAGYRDNGPPGERSGYHPGYYGAFVLDPDGNNVEVVCHNR